MDSVFFLLYCASNTLMYTLLKFFHVKISSYSTLEIMSYSNITSFLVLSPYVVTKIKRFSTVFKKHLGLAINPIAAALKVYVVQFVSPKNAMVISFMQPIFIVIISVLTIEKAFKISIKQYMYIPLSFLGMLVFLGSDFQKYTAVYAIMLLHVIMKAFAYVYIKKIASDRYETLSYSTLYFALFAICIVFRNFEFKMLYHPYVLVIAIISTLSQLVLIRSYEIATKISLLQNLDYSRILFTFIWSWLILKEKIATNQIIGVVIIVSSIYLSDFSKLNKMTSTLIAKVMVLPRKRKR